MGRPKKINGFGDSVKYRVMLSDIGDTENLVEWDPDSISVGDIFSSYDFGEKFDAEILRVDDDGFFINPFHLRGTSYRFKGTRVLGYVEKNDRIYTSGQTIDFLNELKTKTIS